MATNSRSGKRRTDSAYKAWRSRAGPTGGRAACRWDSCGETDCRWGRRPRLGRRAGGKAVQLQRGRFDKKIRTVVAGGMCSLISAHRMPAFSVEGQQIFR